jgi:metal-responsive CopG/Arc/MetJ family transcriptional regulator
MKTKLSITIDEKTNKDIDKILKNKQFRNKSHLIELAVMKLLEAND